MNKVHILKDGRAFRWDLVTHIEPVGYDPEEFANIGWKGVRIWFNNPGNYVWLIKGCDPQELIRLWQEWANR